MYHAHSTLPRRLLLSAIVETSLCSGVIIQCCCDYSVLLCFSFFNTVGILLRFWAVLTEFEISHIAFSFFVSVCLSVLEISGQFFKLP